MELGHAIQQAVDLNLYLYDRALHPELFRHFLKMRVSQTRYHADISIIGLGHVVTVHCGVRSVTELIAGESDVLPSRGVLTRFRMKGERDLEKQIGDGWQYLISTQVETMEEPLFKAVHSDLYKHASKRDGFVPYEQWADGDMAPFSYIDHEARDREFHVHAFHSFPAERTIVKTQSIFEMPKP
jgi:hypothetical protein